MTTAMSETSKELVSGYEASPGITSGSVRIIQNTDHLDQVVEGDILVAEMTKPDMVPAMKRAAGIVTDNGGITSHTAIVSRELGIPAVVGCENATSVLQSDSIVTVDGKQGVVTAGKSNDEVTDNSIEEPQPEPSAKPITATEVKVNISIPEAAERAAATGADGVGLLRTENILLSVNKTPKRYIKDHGKDAYIDEIADGICTIAQAFYPRPVRARTLDVPTDELSQLEGGSEEPREHNPMLGYRGIRRSLNEPEVCKCTLRAFKRLYARGYDNLEIMFPLANDKNDIEQARVLMEEVDLDPKNCSWGVMIETPASALCIEEIATCDIDFVSFGTNDLIQFVLAVDRNNGNIADRFDGLHPAVLKLISRTIECCREHDIATSIAGQAGSRPAMIRFLVDKGVTSISANIDAIGSTQREVDRTEQRLILEKIRN